MNNLHQIKIDNFMQENDLVFKKFQLINKIGQGSFGNIYSVKRIKDNKLFALKAEKMNSGIKLLESEAYYLLMLQGFGIPKFISFGHTKKYYILIEELLDKSLENIFIENTRKANILDICLIGIQILDRLEWIHSKDIIYRDIKPANFLFGIKDPNVIYIIDFGICKKYRSSKTGKHVSPRLTKQFSGTIRYASFNVLNGKEPSRRDDLISLGYMLIRFLKGDLPWDTIGTIYNNTQFYYLRYLKENDGNGKLFNNLPEEIIEYIKYTKNLKFEQDPDYSFLRSLFNKIIFRKYSDYRNLTFSWINEKYKDLNGFPNNLSFRKSSSHKRIFKNIRDSSIERLEKIKRELSQKNNINKNYRISSADEFSINVQSKNSNLYDNNNIIEINEKNSLSNRSRENSSFLDENNLKIIKIGNIIENNKNENNIKKINKIINKENPIDKVNVNTSFINSLNNEKNNIKKKIKKIPIPKRNNINIIKDNLYMNYIDYNPNNINNKRIKYLKNNNLKKNYYLSNLSDINIDNKSKENIPMNNNTINKTSIKLNHIFKNPNNYKKLNRIPNNLSNLNKIKIRNLLNNKIKNTSNINKKDINIILINNNIMERKIYQSPLQRVNKERSFTNFNNDVKLFLKKNKSAQKYKPINFNKIYIKNHFKKIIKNRFNKIEV